MKTKPPRFVPVSIPHNDEEGASWFVWDRRENTYTEHPTREAMFAAIRNLNARKSK